MTYIIGVLIVLAIGYTLLRGAPYVPSHAVQLRAAFTSLRKLDKQDTLLDIGSGDGIVLRQAVRHGAGRAIGVEINPLLALLARLFCVRYRGSIDIVWKDFFYYSIPEDVTVVYIFGDRLHIRGITQYLRRHVENTGRPLDVISHGFQLPDQQPKKSHNAHYLYTLKPLHVDKT